jgi:hypothetical protein
VAPTVHQVGPKMSLEWVKICSVRMYWSAFCWARAVYVATVEAVTFRKQELWYPSWRYLYLRARKKPIPVAARSKTWLSGRSLAGTAGSNPVRSMGVFCLVSVVCCQVEVCAKGRSLFQRSPIVCVYLSLSVIRCNSNSLRLQWLGQEVRIRKKERKPWDWKKLRNKELHYFHPSKTLVF